MNIISMSDRRLGLLQAGGFNDLQNVVNGAAFPNGAIPKSETTNKMDGSAMIQATSDLQKTFHFETSSKEKHAFRELMEGYQR